MTVFKEKNKGKRGSIKLAFIYLPFLTLFNMKNYLKHDEWCIIEEGFTPEYNRISESIFSIGNGRMGQRANFEENYSGDSLQGSYVAGVYYPDKTKVGWWKNGYPEYFAKVLNATNWIGIDIEICLLYTSPSPRDLSTSRMPSSA